MQVENFSNCQVVVALRSGRAGSFAEIPAGSVRRLDGHDYSSTGLVTASDIEAGLAEFVGEFGFDLLGLCPRQRIEMFIERWHQAQSHSPSRACGVDAREMLRGPVLGTIAALSDIEAVPAFGCEAVEQNDVDVMTASCGLVDAAGDDLSLIESCDGIQLPLREERCGNGPESSQATCVGCRQALAGQEQVSSCACAPCQRDQGVFAEQVQVVGRKNLSVTHSKRARNNACVMRLRGSGRLGFSAAVDRQGTVSYMWPK